MIEFLCIAQVAFATTPKHMVVGNEAHSSFTLEEMKAIVQSMNFMKLFFKTCSYICVRTNKQTTKNKKREMVP